MTDEHLISELNSQAGELIQRGQIIEHAAKRIVELNQEVEDLKSNLTEPGGTSEPPSTNSDLQVGVTMGLEVVDHLDKKGSYESLPFEGVKDPAVIRVFYHMDKSTPNACAPKDMPGNFRYYTGEESRKGFEWYEKVWFYRLKTLRERFPDTLFIISTEIAETPDGDLAKFPNRNWKENDWKDGRQVKMWVSKFLIESEKALGSNWIWQLSSEPWDVDWQWFHEKCLSFYEELDNDGAVLPQLMTPAFPIGQGEENQFGTNKWWGRSIRDFIPERYRHLYDYVALHNYPITDNKWDSDLSGWKNKIDLFNAAIEELGMGDCKKACTEFGYDMEDANAEQLMQGMANELDSRDFSIATIYNYRDQNDGSHFDNCYLQNRDGSHHPSYDLIDSTKDIN